MYDFVNKNEQVNVRVKPELKSDLEVLAEFHGLTVSSYVHSILTRHVRKEKENEKELFARHEHDVNEKRKLAPVVARIEPAEGMTKDEIRRRLLDEPPALKLGDQQKRKKTG